MSKPRRPQVPGGSGPRSRPRVRPGRSAPDATPSDQGHAQASPHAGIGPLTPGAGTGQVGGELPKAKPPRLSKSRTAGARGMPGARPSRKTPTFEAATTANGATWADIVGPQVANATASGPKAIPTVARQDGEEVVAPQDAHLTARTRLHTQPTSAGAVLAQAEERFTERRRSRRRRVVIVAAAWCVGLVLAAAGAWLLLLSNVLTLHGDKIRVEDTGPYVDGQAVVRVVASATGIPLARIDAGSLVKRIRLLPGVRDARIDRSWPNGMIVRIMPRQPVLSVPVAGGFRLVDDTATQVAYVPQSPAGLQRAELGERADVATVKGLLQVLASLPKELSSQVVKVGADDSQRIWLETAKVRIEWGGANDSTLKSKVVLTLMANPGPGAFSRIDVSAPTMPVTR